MAPVIILTIRGCGEPMVGNMLTPVWTPLVKDPDYKHVELNYPATLGPAGSGGPFAPSEQESVRIGCMELDRQVAAAPGWVVLLWYSLGGVVGTEWLNTRKISRPELYEKVILGGGIANPRRAQGRSYRRRCGGEGIFAADQDHSIAWAEFAAPGDPITAMPADSPLRQGSDLIQWMSLSNPLKWAQDVLEKLPRVRQQLLGESWVNAFNPAFWLRFKVAADMMIAYAAAGAHTDAYRRPNWRNWRNEPRTAIQLLTDCVQSCVDAHRELQ